MAGLIKWKKQSIPPANPDSDHLFVGIDSADDLLYTKDDAGVVTKFPTLSQVGAAVLSTVLTGLSLATSTAVVDTDTVLEAFGKLQAQINNILNSLYKDYESELTGLINQSSTLAEFLSLSATIPVTGDYKISWSYEWSVNDAGEDFVAQIELDNSTNLMDHRQEPKDVGGTGIVLDVVGGGTANTGTNQRFQCSGHTVRNLTAGVHTIDLDWAGSVGGIEAAIYRAELTIERY